MRKCGILWQKGCRKSPSVHLWRSDRGGERVSQRWPGEGGKTEAEAAFHVRECVLGMMTEQTTSSALRILRGFRAPSAQREGEGGGFLGCPRSCLFVSFHTADCQTEGSCTSPTGQVHLNPRQALI